MFSIIIVALVVIVLVYFAYKDISKVPFNTHKLMNNSHYLDCPILSQDKNWLFKKLPMIEQPEKIP